MTRMRVSRIRDNRPLSVKHTLNHGTHLNGKPVFLHTVSCTVNGSNIYPYLRNDYAVNSVEKGMGKRVVKDLTGDVKGKNHHVYFDNFFTSLDLVVDLEKDSIYSCGTARKDRKGFPPE